MVKLVRLTDNCQFIKTIDQQYNKPLVITHAWTEVPDDYNLSGEMEEHPDTVKAVPEIIEEESVIEEPIVEPEIEEVVKYAKEALIDMTKAEQVVIIKKLAGADTNIPRLEKDRVALILKLQG